MGVLTRAYEASGLHADVIKEVVRSHAWATCRGLTAYDMLMNNTVEWIEMINKGKNKKDPD